MASGTGHNTRSSRTRDAEGVPPDGAMNEEMDDPEHLNPPLDDMFEDGEEEELEPQEPPGPPRDLPGTQDTRPPSTPRNVGPPSIGSANSGGTSKRNNPSLAGRSGTPGASPARSHSEGRGYRQQAVLDTVAHMETLYNRYNEALIDYDNSRDLVTLAEASETRQMFNLAFKEVQRVHIKAINSFEDAHTRSNW